MASLELFDITDRRVLVVGGTSGIGKQLALGFRAAGAQVAAVGRRTDEALATELGTPPWTIDVTSSESVEVLRDEVLAKWGGLDVLVNCAGRTFRKPTATVTDEEWNGLFETNLTGMVRTCRTFHGALRDSGRGRIINIASLSSHVAFHEVAAYGASKAGVLALTQSLGCEWAKDGIRTNAIVPGVFVTDLNRDLLMGTGRGQELLARTPLGRFGDVSELVGVALFLASDAVSFITGAAIPVDGGFLASGVNQ